MGSKGTLRLFGKMNKKDAGQLGLPERPSISRRARC